MNSLNNLPAVMVENAERVESMLPRHVTFDAFQRAIANAVMRNPDLMQCDGKSLFTAIAQCAQDGLIPDNREACIVSYKNNKENRIEARYQPMIDGVLKRIRQSGVVANITAKAVYEHDEFTYWFDEDGEHVRYTPKFGERGVFKLAFAYAKLDSGELIIEVMDKDDIDRVRAASKSGTNSNGPWVNWFDRMAVKSVYHRLARRLPSSSEVAQMIDVLERDIDAQFEKEVKPEQFKQVGVDPKAVHAKAAAISQHIPSDTAADLAQLIVDAKDEDGLHKASLAISTAIYEKMIDDADSQWLRDMYKNKKRGT